MKKVIAFLTLVFSSSSLAFLNFFSGGDVQTSEQVSPKSDREHMVAVLHSLMHKDDKRKLTYGFGCFYVKNTKSNYRQRSSMFHVIASKRPFSIDWSNFPGRIKISHWSKMTEGTMSFGKSEKLNFYFVDDLTKYEIGNSRDVLNHALLNKALFTDNDLKNEITKSKGVMIAIQAPDLMEKPMVHLNTEDKNKPLLNYGDAENVFERMFRIGFLELEWGKGYGPLEKESKYELNLVEAGLIEPMKEILAKPNCGERNSKF